MLLDPAQRHQIKQDAVTTGLGTERLVEWDTAIARLRQDTDLDRDDEGDQTRLLPIPDLVAILNAPQQFRRAATSRPGDSTSR